MNSPNFVHLHVHTQYSLLDGASRIKDLVAQAVEYGMPAIGMSDHGNMSGALEMYDIAHKNGIKPIIGVEAYIATKGTRFDKSPEFKRSTSHLTLFAKDVTGYKNLTRLVSAGFLEGFYYNPRIDKDILAKHSKGLICASGCLRGEVSGHLMKDDYNAALKAADEHRQMFAQGDYYIEMMNHGLDIQKGVNENLVKIAKELSLPLVATNDVHYVKREQSAAHDALLCIQTQSTLDDPKRMRLPCDEFFFKSPQMMAERFAATPQALTNTLEIAEKCNLKLNFDDYHLPRFDPPKGLTQEQYLEQLCEEAIPTRYGKRTSEVEVRLKHEIETIKKMGFVAYFLIVWDFIHFAKEKGIPVGPGRGSAAGSIVSYLLGITDLDPIGYGLLFERFLNPDRAGMPDIDIDFCYERRGEIIEYVTQKYGGPENVAQIITFGTLQARAAIRDVGRVMSVPYGDVDRIAKLIPNDLGITLEEALEKEPQLQELCDNDILTRKVMATAQVLEGLHRHASTHAAGVVIADQPLSEYVPLYKTSDGQVTTGFTMNGIAKMGLLKMDFLGLRTLTVISEAVKTIKEIHDIDVDIDTVTLDDQKTYDMLSQANSFGVFQLESAGMRELLKKICPSEFEDLISILALYRPGPMGSGMLDDFIERKRGDVSVKYFHPKLEALLKPTYGIIIFQEQVMQIPVILAGFSLVQADHLRRAMSKKIQSVMDKMRKDFVAGCQKHSAMTADESNKLFDLIDYFSGYGFNRSHSAAYAMITYRTAYLKANYPVEFMCSLLNSEKNNTDKIVEYIKESENMGIKIMPPDINQSFKEFHVVDQKTIQYGLLALKNVGSSAIDSIVESRKDGPYESLHNLCERVDLRLCNKKVYESLIKCGAMDDFGAYRSQMMALIESALELGAKKQKEKASGQMSFFDLEHSKDVFDTTDMLPDIKEWPHTQLLAFEKEVLGFYVSGHPLSHYKAEIKEFTDFSTKNLYKAHEGEDVRIVGLISYIKLTNTKRTGERMAILRLEDTEGEVEVVVFPSDYKKLSSYINEGEVIFLSGKVSLRDDEIKIIGNEMKHIHDVYGTIKAINVDLSAVGKDGLKELKKQLKKSPGRVPVYLNVTTKSNKSVQILVGEDLYVAPNDRLMNDIKELVGKDKFSMTF